VNQNAAVAAETAPAASSTGGKELKSWERPWSLKELRHAAHDAQWNLAADAGLYNYLEDFSRKLMERTKATQDTVDDLVNFCTATTIGTHNVFNEFLLLSNSQFIENRVYEEDETVSAATGEEEKVKKTEEKKTAIEIEEMLVPKYTEAIASGLNALMLSNQLVSELPVDGEGNVEENLFVDVYSLHALPHVIGTPEFHEDENCGLYYLSDEDEITQEFLTDEEEEEGGALYSDEDSFDSESEKEEGELMDEEEKLAADQAAEAKEPSAPVADVSSSDTSSISDIPESERSEDESSDSDLFDSDGDVASDSQISKAEQKKKEREERRAKRREEKNC